MKLNRKNLRKLILEEIKLLREEDRMEPAETTGQSDEAKKAKLDKEEIDELLSALNEGGWETNDVVGVKSLGNRKYTAQVSANRRASIDITFEVIDGNW